ncbi:hypothetical protein BATDEDRAFT_21536 [Batrachochytrium dendrobatidis JAM81]|uniref:IGFBP N-terminal domain-containing protein n=2 Tax=Batrachochytrium dendrobatidis TaxID=109871 RepID=F4NTR1_BATDJ|nr:uncharacterized protein BATDEDRAFT_21536 [Batrachochytrium dendrobatidis JAM81]EGF83941.1 hypothetical protein BATDEDRAFT_21536 [Batrachochytrium dendrobatidis JAM81]KAJ8331300.1 hypothetical protein O5D80_000233 [Batrachochytrium dendrobatidis]KAK5671751.1 hypothetical protein QVD99_001586 [Batrachochytrium dendrobatidis]OAJ36248.1 hypothetical protein BDEG_20441 [Batrachochytrium dendrobatidis JEL423]|eukprot:XP_006675313.1 hypothetical protein BATDEDRAFT_21536 [Batrachochytrium dendrobatidis JAM81]
MIANPSTLSAGVLLAAIASVAAQQTGDVGSSCGTNLAPLPCITGNICARPPGIDTTVAGMCIPTGSTIASLGGPCGGLMRTAPSCFFGQICKSKDIPDVGGVCVDAATVSPAASTGAHSTATIVSPGSSSSVSLPGSTSSPAPGSKPASSSVMSSHVQPLMLIVASIVLAANVIF